MYKSNDTIEGQLKALLSGNGLQDENIFCDFTLTDQNEALGEFKKKKINGRIQFLGGCSCNCNK